jgi:hypothetical protein
MPEPCLARRVRATVQQNTEVNVALAGRAAGGMAAEEPWNVSCATRRFTVTTLPFDPTGRGSGEAPL